MVSRALRLRRDWPDLFAGYAPVLATGPAAEHALAYDRGGVITVATRLPVAARRPPAAGATPPSTWAARATDVITGRRVPREIALAELLDTYPVALLVR